MRRASDKATLTPRAPTEEEVERAIRTRAEAVGIEVFKCSQGYRGVFDPDGVRADGGRGKYVPTRGGTRMTEGLADLELWIPIGRGDDARLVLGKWETKTAQGLKDHERLSRLSYTDMMRTRPSAAKDWKRAQAQARYEALCTVAGTPYGRGGVAEFERFLVGLDLARQQPEQRGHATLLIRASRNPLERVAEVLRRLVAPLPPAPNRLG